MAYHRLWFFNRHLAWTVGGGMMHNPGRYLVLAPTGNASPVSQPLNVPAASDRCNPLSADDECNSGLSCQQPATCAENYCCPTSGTSTNPFCNGSACPAPSADAGGEDAAADGNTE
jgi:hypothetical protein